MCSSLNVDNCYAIQLLFLKNIYDSDFDLCFIIEPHLIGDAIPVSCNYVAYINGKTTIISKKNITKGSNKQCSFMRWFV